ncbi:MAG: chalcone isomerase family protein [Pseudomonadota bacterium]|nr:chalcone isomerase family protein [Pseudomonadota bacterium]
MLNSHVTPTVARLFVPFPLSLAPAFLLSLLLGLAPSVPARELAGIAVVEQVLFAGKRLQLNGTGVRKFFGFNVYVAALYLPEPARSEAEILEREMPWRLQLTMLRDTSTEQNLDALNEGLLGNNSAAELGAIKAEVARFFALIQQVNEVPAGTVIQLDYQPGKGTHTRIGNRDLGLIPGERFNRAILKIWLGEMPTQLSLKKALLGQDAL